VREWREVLDSERDQLQKVQGRYREGTGKVQGRYREWREVLDSERDQLQKSARRHMRHSPRPEVNLAEIIGRPRRDHE
jgi:hypothetical protein